MVRFFKKLSPEIAVVTSDGRSVKFSTINDLVGYFATDVEYLHQEFEKCMREQRYGITEISPDEFTTDYVEPKKKVNGTISKPLWREEIGARASILTSNPINKLGVAAVQRAVAVSGTSDITAKKTRQVGLSMVEDIAPSPATPTTAPAQQQQAKEEFAPKTARRTRTKKE